MNDKTSNEKQIIFHALDREAEIQITERNLPHWFQPDVAIFITFRLADSLPAEVLLRWQRELEEWLAVRDLPKNLSMQIVSYPDANRHECLRQFTPMQKQEFKRLSDRIFHRSLDECHGSCVLRRPELAKIVGDAIRFFDDERYDLDRFIVMPNHVHVLAQFRPGYDLDTVSQSWMRFTARQINKHLGTTGALWQAEPFDHIIRSPEQFVYLQKYISDNPQKAQLPPKNYLYWQRE